jgi:hypothetical protein
VSHERIYNDGDVNRSVSNVGENKDEVLAQKQKWKGDSRQLILVEVTWVKRTINIPQIKCKLASKNNKKKKTQVQVLGI